MPLITPVRKIAGRLKMKEVPSPCTLICTLDQKTGLCTGCLRNLEEISNWIVYSNEKKRRILQKIEQRKQNKPGAA